MTVKDDFTTNVSNLIDIAYVQVFGGFELVTKGAPQNVKKRNWLMWREIFLDTGQELYFISYA